MCWTEVTGEQSAPGITDTDWRKLSEGLKVWTDGEKSFSSLGCQVGAEERPPAEPSWVVLPHQCTGLRTHNIFDKWYNPQIFRTPTPEVRTIRQRRKNGFHFKVLEKFDVLFFLTQ